MEVKVEVIVTVPEGTDPQDVQNCMRDMLWGEDYPLICMEDWYGIVGTEEDPVEFEVTYA